MKKIDYAIVDFGNIENQLYCGQIKENSLDCLSKLFYHAMIPNLQVLDKWGPIQSETKNSIILNVEKTTKFLYDQSIARKHDIPKEILENPIWLKQAAGNLTQVAGTNIQTEDYEQLASNWISTIEKVLSDDEREDNDNFPGPSSERHYWKKKQSLLGNLTEQLKSRSCKIVIGFLITAKSPILKRWRTADIYITDAVNSARERVKYLDSLAKYFDEMEDSRCTPQKLMSVIIPGIMESMLLMDSASRFHARSGFLGILFTQITNQIVKVCQRYLSELVDNEKEGMWKKIEYDFKTMSSSDFNELTIRQLKAKLEEQAKEARNERLMGVAKAFQKDRHAAIELGVDENKLIGRIKICGLLANVFQEEIKALRETLSAQGPLSRAGSTTSQNSTVSVSAYKRQSMSQGTGVSTNLGTSINDDLKIMMALERFIQRIRMLTNVIRALFETNLLLRGCVGLPKPRREHIEQEEKSAVAQLSNSFAVSKEVSDSNFNTKPALELLHQHQPALGVISEDQEERATSALSETARDNKEHKIPEPIDDYSVISQEDLILFKRHFDGEDHDPNISEVIDEYQKHMYDVLSDINGRIWLNLQPTEEIFDNRVANFHEIANNFERLLCTYVHIVMMRSMITPEALNVLKPFLNIENMTALKNTIQDKMVGIFMEFEDDLVDIRDTYEEYKHEPQRPRNSPPIAGAIAWSRQLLSSIDRPMQVFQSCKAVTHAKDYHRIVKKHYKIATALAKFETIYLNSWKEHLDSHLTSVRSSLLRVDLTSKRLVTNMDPRLLELIEESRCLCKMGIEVPKNLIPLLQNEAVIKHYGQKMNEVLNRFYDIVDRIPDNLKPLFFRRLDETRKTFLPGLSTLSWSSFNIDTFIHKVENSVDVFGSTVNEVINIINNEIDAVLKQISETSLLDLNLMYSQLWNVDDYLEAMKHCTSVQKDFIKMLVLKMENGLKKIFLLLTKVKMDKFNRRNVRTKENVVDKENINALPKVEEEDLIVELIDFYSSEMYNSLRNTIQFTLISLIQATGSETNLANQQHPSFEISNPQPQKSFIDDDINDDDEATTTSPLSQLSKMPEINWFSEDKLINNEFIRFAVNIKHEIPSVTLQPKMDLVQNVLNEISLSVLHSCQDLVWFHGENIGKVFVQKLLVDLSVNDLMQQITNVTSVLWPEVQTHLKHIQTYDFLWKENLSATFDDFLSHQPTDVQLRREVANVQRLEQQLQKIPQELAVGCIALQVTRMKDVLLGFVMTWKDIYASSLHKEAKRQLDASVSYRERVNHQLQADIETLDELNEALQLLEELGDLENQVDCVYLPIETMYNQLDAFKIVLPREERALVFRLREDWVLLIKAADAVRHELLHERKSQFEQELDKQLKNFVVEVMQFRNSFDAQGPAVPGIEPSEAVARLQQFQTLYDTFAQKRQTLDSVCKLFGFLPKTYSELDRTGEELQLLCLLYGLFSKFIAYDEHLRGTLWADVDLEHFKKELEDLWDECLALPSKLKDWSGYYELRGRLQAYLLLIPLLIKLASKEIKNRHWLLVMTVTGSFFQLESSVFKLDHLIDIGMVANRQEIEEICVGAQKEMHLELKLKQIQEEWTEQVLAFQNHKRRGPLLLDNGFTEHLLEQLEDSQTLIATMLTSKHITPLRDEAAAWTEKLRMVAEVLEIWLDVQNLWSDLEAVFSVPENVKELAQDSKHFMRLDKGYVKFLKRAFETKNVLQCCLGGEVSKTSILKHMAQEMEACFKNLGQFLENKRQQFPRLCYVSDQTLLHILSHPRDLDSVQPHLRFLFSAIQNIETRRKNVDADNVNGGENSGQQSVFAHNSPSEIGVPETKRTNMLGMDDDARSTVSKIKRTNSLSQAALHVGSGHLDDLMEDAFVISEMTGVRSADGEQLTLDHSVDIVGNVDTWLSELHFNIAETLRRMLSEVVKDMATGGQLEEMAYKYPSQICRVGLLYYWTRECELAINDVKNDRKAIQAVAKRYNTIVSRLPAILYRGAWRNIDDVMMNHHKLRLRNMVNQALYLRDCLDLMTQRRIRDPMDFDWRRNVRCYVHASESDSRIKQPFIYLLDEKFDYGCEYQGGFEYIACTSLTERCFLAMVSAMQQCRGQILQGSPGSGKSTIFRGLSQLIGYHLVPWEAFSRQNFGFKNNNNESSSRAQKAYLARLLVGLAADGSWAMLSHVERFSADLWSLLLQYSQAIFQAIRTGQNNAFIGDTECSIASTTALFLTANISASGHNVIPSHCKSHFRALTLMNPNITQILRTKALAYDFKAPHILASRLKLISDLAREQLPKELREIFSMKSLCQCLSLGQKYRTIARDPNFSHDGLLSAGGSQHTTQGQLGQSEYWPPHRERNSPSAGTIKTSVTKKNNTPNPLTSSAKQEHGFVLAALLELLVSAVPIEFQVGVRNIITEVFSGVEEPQKIHASMKDLELRKTMQQITEERHLTASKSWLDKCHQIYHTSQVHSNIIVYGPAGHGKTAVINTLISALSQMAMRDNESLKKYSDFKDTNGQMDAPNHRLQVFYPQAFNSLETLYGLVTNEGDWTDGLISWSLKKANRNHSITWLCFDGSLSGAWTDGISTLLSSERILYLPNGNQLPATDRLRLLFETENVADVSPSMMTKSGLVYIGEDTLSWKLITTAWLKTRNKLQITVLSKIFDKTIDQVINFISTDARNKINLPTTMMLQNCLTLLDAMLTENKELGGELHIQRLFIFCLLWTFGAFMNRETQKQFSDFLKGVTGALPDDDRDICVFDYYVDESGEWDPWTAKLEECIADEGGLSGLENVPIEIGAGSNLVVLTPAMIRNRVLLEFAHINKMNILLVGPHGGGKSTLMNYFVSNIDTTTTLQKELVCCASSRVDDIQAYIEGNLHHRQGFVYGAKDGKRLLLCIEDMNATHDKEESVIELFRSILDRRLLLTSESPFSWKQIEDVSLLGTMAISEAPAIDAPWLSNRMMSHVFPLNVPKVEGENLRTIFSGLLTSTKRFSSNNPLSNRELDSSRQDDWSFHLYELKQIVNLACGLLEDCRIALMPSTSDGRRLYLFELHHLQKLVLSLQRLKFSSDSNISNEQLTKHYVSYELRRIFRDSICRHSDLKWFDDVLDERIRTEWPTQMEEENDSLPPQHFITFENDTRVFQRGPPSSLKNNGGNRMDINSGTPAAIFGQNYHPIPKPIYNLSEVKSCLEAQLNRYNEEFGNDRLSVSLSDTAIEHVLRVHRLLNSDQNGNIILIGSIGTHLSTLCQLAAHVAQLPIWPLVTNDKMKFFEGLRWAVRHAGTEDKSGLLLLTGRNLSDGLALDALNSILVSGYYPPLFTREELDSLIQIIAPSLKKTGIAGNVDIHQFLRNQVRKNLHIVLCLSPHHSLLSTALLQYPGFLTCCHINWYCDWPLESLFNEAKYFMERNAHEMQLNQISFWREQVNNPNVEEKEHEAKIEIKNLELSVTTTLAHIHSLVLQECNQIPWAGVQTDEINITNVRILEKKKDTLRIQNTKMPNEPYCKVIVQELIRKAHRKTDEVNEREVSISPITFQRLLQCFEFVYSRKRHERRCRVRLIKQALLSLSQARHDNRILLKEFERIKRDYADARNNVDKLLKLLCDKSTFLEKSRAYHGESSALTAFLHMHAQDDDDWVEEDDLLTSSTPDKYDTEFDKIREETRKNRQRQMKEEFVNAKQQYDLFFKELNYARDQVNFWRSKVDRACIDRIKTFQNPPFLVGQVMEMIFFLVGKPVPGMSYVSSGGGLLSSSGGGVISNVSTGKGNARMQQVGAGGDDESTPSRVSLTSGLLGASAQRRNMNNPQSTNKTANQLQDRVDKAQWKLMQQSMSDSNKFVDMLHNISWEDGVDADVLKVVETYLAKGRDGQLGVTGEGSLLENAETTNIKAIKRGNTHLPSAQQQVTSAEDWSTENDRTSGNISISAAKYASEDAATLVHYCIALVEYSKRCGPLKKILSRIHDLKREIEENDIRERGINVEDHNQDLTVQSDEKNVEDIHHILPDELNNELLQLKTDYEQAVMRKYTLTMELRALEQRLKSGQDMTNILVNMETIWQAYESEFATEASTLGDCIIVASYLTYCAALPSSERVRIMKMCVNIARQNKLIVSPSIATESNSEDNTLLHFIFREIADVESVRLSAGVYWTPLQMRNAAPLLVDPQCMGAWPLLCDSSCQAIDWIKMYFSKWSINVVHFRDLRAALESSLSEGGSLLITHCDLDKLSKDPHIRPVLLNQRRFLQSKMPIKLFLDDHEVECQPKFRLYLHCIDSPAQVPTNLSAMTCVLNFQQSRECIEESLLTLFVHLEKRRLETEIHDTIKNKIENLYQLTALEEEILEHLNSSERLMYDIGVVRTVIDLAKQREVIKENLARIRISEENYRRARDTYRPIAKRAAVCFDVVHNMRHIHPAYQFSYDTYLKVFRTSVQHSDRTSTKVVMDRLVFNSYQNAIQSVLDKDRPIYEIMLALEICDSSHPLMIGEREFIISPQLGAAVVTAYITSLNSPNPVDSNKYPDVKFSQAKKPFDWMLDEQYTNLQLLACHFPWFQDMFDRMSRDGRETQWRSLVENDQPENSPLPDKMDECLSPLQRFAILRSVRPDRIMQISRNFVVAVLGKKYSVEYKWEKVMNMESNETIFSPTIILYQDDASMVEQAFLQEATTQGIKEKQVIYIGSGNADDVQTFRRSLHHFGKTPEESWLLLTCVHPRGHSSALISALISFFQEKFVESANRSRLFVALSSKHIFYDNIMQFYPRISIDHPINVRDAVLHGLLNSVTSDMHRCLQARQEWPSILHNCLLLHGIISLRSRFALSGWNESVIPVSANDPTSVIMPQYNALSDAIAVLRRELGEDSQNSSVSGPFAVINPIGNNATNYGRASSPSASVNLGRSSSPLFTESKPNKLEEAMIVPRGLSWQELKYQLTDIIYGASVQEPYDQLSLSAIVDFWLSPGSLRKEFEVPKLKYRIPASFLGSHSRYINLTQAVENIPVYYFDSQEACHLHSSPENVLGFDQYVFTRVNLVYDRMPNTQSLKHVLFDRPQTPRTGPLQSMVSNVSSNAICESQGVLASSSLIHWRGRREVELWEICYNLLSKVPKVCSKEYINERVKKIGGLTPFNIIIVNELRALIQIINTIRTSLLNIKNVMELDQLGDKISFNDFQVADALMHSRLPEQWRVLAGESAPPASYSVVTWLAELQMRSQHFERILVLGREKNPAYALNAFSNPRSLLSLWKQEAYVIQSKADRSGAVENIVFNVEITARDKEHLRDPPQEGYFVYGLNLWGCAWDKSSGELSDLPNKSLFTSMPVMLLTCVSSSSSLVVDSNNADVNRVNELFQCPVFLTRQNRREPIMEINLKREGIPASRWSLRGVYTTLRPY